MKVDNTELVNAFRATKAQYEKDNNDEKGLISLIEKAIEDLFDGEASARVYLRRFKQLGQGVQVEIAFKTALIDVPSLPQPTVEGSQSTEQPPSTEPEVS